MEKNSIEMFKVHLKSFIKNEGKIGNLNIGKLLFVKADNKTLAEEYAKDFCEFLSTNSNTQWKVDFLEADKILYKVKSIEEYLIDKWHPHCNCKDLDLQNRIKKLINDCYLNKQRYRRLVQMYRDAANTFFRKKSCNKNCSKEVCIEDYGLMHISQIEIKSRSCKHCLKEYDREMENLKRLASKKITKKEVREYKRYLINLQEERVFQPGKNNW